MPILLRQSGGALMGILGTILAVIGVAFVFVPSGGAVVSVLCIVLGLVLSATGFVRNRNRGQRRVASSVGIACNVVALLLMIAAAVAGADSSTQPGEVRVTPVPPTQQVLVSPGAAVTDSGGSTRQATVTQDPTATQEPTPERVWSVGELLDCDTTTLRMQMRGEEDAGLMSECEVEISLALLRMLGALEDLPTREKAQVEARIDTLDRIKEQTQGLVADVAVDSSEAAYLCEAVPQWRDQVQELRDWVSGRDPVTWQWVRLEIARFDRFSEGVMGIC